MSEFEFWNKNGFAKRAKAQADEKKFTIDEIIIVNAEVIDNRTCTNIALTAVSTIIIINALIT